ncbi:hypothetical protein [Sporosarcina gallistercoris]|uniref:Uncharacterized protein n=1 Tax=Sporosarcina gallistercoris TaxID=2762245 RepID=A0ABR8PLN4_9BACL|nr:hypothetical protein [Sporosarcina gallistercoris]MBD7909083.1 hypothetical protein [Sporosarcina gallistercoris]
MNFEEYLSARHELVENSKKLSEVTIEQYVNRFHNLQRRGIYTDEREVTDEILQQIEQQYKNGLQHYPIPLRYYLEYLDYMDQTAEVSAEEVSSEVENTLVQV